MKLNPLAVAFWLAILFWLAVIALILTPVLPSH